MRKTPEPIDSVDSLRRRMPTFVRAVNGDRELALRAAANPLLALEELGYSLTERMRRYAEHRVRFTEEEAATLTRLADEIEKLAGKPVDLQSRTSVVQTLGRLRVKVPAPNGGDDATQTAASPRATARGSRAAASSRRVAQQPPEPEVVLPPDDSRRLLPVLEPLVGKHPIVEPLVAYLRLEATQPRLAPREVYDVLRARKEDPARTEITVRFVLHRGREDG